jgi:hypothetical protein
MIYLLQYFHLIFKPLTSTQSLLKSVNENQSLNLNNSFIHLISAIISSNIILTQFNIHLAHIHRLLQHPAFMKL